MYLWVPRATNTSFTRSVSSDKNEKRPVNMVVHTIRRTKKPTVIGLRFNGLSRRVFPSSECSLNNYYQTVDKYDLLYFPIPVVSRSSPSSSSLSPHYYNNVTTILVITTILLLRYYNITIITINWNVCMAMSLNQDKYECKTRKHYNRTKIGTKLWIFVKT